MTFDVRVVQKTERGVTRMKSKLRLIAGWVCLAGLAAWMQRLCVLAGVAAGCLGGWLVDSLHGWLRKFLL